MADTIDDRSVINNAMARIGAPPIPSLSSDIPQVAQAKAVYYDRVGALLGLYDWSFNAKTYRLDRVDEQPQNGFCHAFSLPGTRLSNTPRRVMTHPLRADTVLRHFTVEADRLYADHDCVYAVFSVAADPSVWPVYFRLGATVACAADFAVPVTHDQNLRDDLLVEAYGTPQMEGRGGLIGQAIAKDASGARQRAAMWSDPLTQAHQGGGPMSGSWAGRFG